MRTPDLLALAKELLAAAISVPPDFRSGL